MSVKTKEEKEDKEEIILVKYKVNLFYLKYIINFKKYIKAIKVYENNIYSELFKIDTNIVPNNNNINVLLHKTAYVTNFTYNVIPYFHFKYKKYIVLILKNIKIFYIDFILKNNNLYIYIKYLHFLESYFYINKILNTIKINNNINKVKTFIKNDIYTSDSIINEYKFCYIHTIEDICNLLQIKYISLIAKIYSFANSFIISELEKLN